MTLVIDIGGGSTEIVCGSGEKIVYKRSFPIGAVSAVELYLMHAPATHAEMENFERILHHIFRDLRKENFNLKKAIAIAGTPTTLACIKMNLKSFDEEVIEGSEINYLELNDLVNKLKLLSPEEILFSFKEVVKGREDVLLSGSYILMFLCELFGLDKVIVSTKGIRYGAIVNFFKNRV